MRQFLCGTTTGGFTAYLARDREKDQRLSEIGWLSVGAWDHEGMDTAARFIAEVALQRRQ